MTNTLRGLQFIDNQLSVKLAEHLFANETVADLLNKICSLTANSCLPEEVKAN